MRIPRHALLVFAILGVGSGMRGQTSITSSGYTQNFDGIGTSLPTDWTLRTGATTTLLGTNGATFASTKTNWTSTTSQFANYASATGLNSASTTTDQSNSTNRALGIRQGASFGDPGAAFVFNFASTGYNITSLSLDLMMLSVQGRSTTWHIQYGLGASPTAFVDLATSYTDPGAFGTTSITLSSGLTGISNQSNVWFRVVALTASSGTSSRDTLALDNFSLTATAIPEPSTYAALFGAFAFAGAMLLRRGRRELESSK